MKQTPDKILNDIRRTLKDASEYTYIIMGKPGPTGKTWLCDQLKRYGYNACEITDSVCGLIDYNDTGNHYLIKKQAHVVVIILNAPIEPAKEMTLEEIEAKLGHRVKVVTNDRDTPRKTAEECKKCKWHGSNSGCRNVSCCNCSHKLSDGTCLCRTIKPGEPCPHFEEDPNNA